MKDLNFFNPYIVKKKLNINKQVAYYLFMLFLIIAIGAYAISNEIRINSMLKEVAKLKRVVEDNKVMDKIDEINKKSNELEFLREDLRQFESYNSFIDENSIINDTLFEMLTASIPEGVFLTSISAYTDEINIIGKSQDQLLIAKFVENIESFKVFKRAFVSSITKEEQFYSFILDICLKDVSIDGENTTIIEETDN